MNFFEIWQDNLDFFSVRWDSWSNTGVIQYLNIWENVFETSGFAFWKSTLIFLNIIYISVFIFSLFKFVLVIQISRELAHFVQFF
jgi:hypothetical protein